MPRRAPPPDRLACEAALLPEDLTSLRAQAKAFGIPLKRWHKVPGFAAVWATYAAASKAEKLRAQHGLPEDRALAIVSEPLGLNDETIRSRLRRFYRHARGL